MDRERFRTALDEIVGELYVIESMAQCTYDGSLYQGDFVPKWREVGEEIAHAEQMLSRLHAQVNFLRYHEEHPQQIKLWLKED